MEDKIPQEVLRKVGDAINECEAGGDYDVLAISQAAITAAIETGCVVRATERESIAVAALKAIAYPMFPSAASGQFSGQWCVDKAKAALSQIEVDSKHLTKQGG